MALSLNEICTDEDGQFLAGHSVDPVGSGDLLLHPGQGVQDPHQPRGEKDPRGGGGRSSGRAKTTATKRLKRGSGEMPTANLRFLFKKPKLIPKIELSD